MTGTQKLVLTSLIVILTFLFSACSHVTVPRGPIQVKMDVVGSLDIPKEISFENGVPDSKLALIGSQGFHKWYADYRVWTSFIVNHLETKILRRSGYGLADYVKRGKHYFPEACVWEPLPRRVDFNSKPWMTPCPV